MTDTKREAFEKALNMHLKARIDRNAFVIGAGNEYVYQLTNTAWFAWQAALAQSQQWISVEDRLPDVKHECTTTGTMVSQSVEIAGISADGSKGVGFGHYHDDGKWTSYSVEYDFFNIENVTHWKKITPPITITKG